ncbi:hypothetical protein [Candidatus Poriferisodalis sp.]|uniref:hypothetical protein n=1 Tax=Candidatus Poriferisodalis sp. TaxID=3101277 RepID=UPI003B52151F
MAEHFETVPASWGQPAEPPAADRDQSGLTTLGWLLITAAVAGLAALAVVLVSGAVSETGEQLANHDPRITAAQHLAFEINLDAGSAGADDFDTWGDWERNFSRRCSQIEILYGDADATVTANLFVRATGGTDFDAAAAGYAAAADELTPTQIKAQAHCSVR